MQTQPDESRKVLNLSSEAIERFLRSMSVNGKADNTVRAYRADLNGLLQYVNPETEEVPDLEFRTKEYLTDNRRTWKSSTTNRKVAAFRAYGAFYGDQTFLSDYKPPQVPAGIAHPIQGGMEAVMKMVEYARKPDHKTMILLCGRLGLRCSEARTVRPCDFAYESDGTFLTVYGKGEKTRIVPVPDDVFAMLGPTILRTESTSPLVTISDRSSRRAITRIGTRALQAHVASHDLRMTTGTAFYEATGGDIRATQELLGHASMDTTQGYTGVSMGKIKKGLEALHVNED